MCLVVFQRNDLKMLAIAGLRNGRYILKKKNCLAKQDGSPSYSQSNREAQADQLSLPFLVDYNTKAKRDFSFL